MSYADEEDEWMRGEGFEAGYTKEKQRYIAMVVGMKQKMR